MNSADHDHCTVWAALVSQSQTQLPLASYWYNTVTAFWLHTFQKFIRFKNFICYKTSYVSIICWQFLNEKITIFFRQNILSLANMIMYILIKKKCPLMLSYSHNNVTFLRRMGEWNRKYNLFCKSNTYMLYSLIIHGVVVL